MDEVELARAGLEQVIHTRGSAFELSISNSGETDGES